jgi:IS30 family transposase
MFLNTFSGQFLMYIDSQMVYHGLMNEVQDVLQRLKENGWTLAAIADEVGVHYNTVQRWDGGTRVAANSRAVVHELERLLTRRRVPKKKRYKRNPPTT